MPAGIGYPPPQGQGGGGAPAVPPDALLQGMEQMVGGAGGAGAPQGPVGPATAPPNDMQGDVVAQLVDENVQLRALLGLGPDDPIPVPSGGGAPEGAAGAQSAQVPPPV